MPKFKPQYRRLMFIDRKIREGKFPSCGRMAAEWEVSRKTIQRDIDYLRDELDVPIAYDPLKRGYYYTEPNYALPAIQISESDLFAVLVAERVLSQYRNTPCFEKIAAVFQRIRDSLPEKTSIDPAWLNERILVFPEPITCVKPDTWVTLAKAIRDNRRVRLIHAAPDTKGAPREERTVDPYYLVSYRGEWYLNGFCHLRQAIRTFGVSRITELSILDESFSMPAGMTAKRMFGDQFGIVWKNKFHKVRIRFTAEVAPYIRERQWHPLQQTRERRDGGLELEFTTNHINEVKDWVLSWGGYATVTTPGVLVEKVKLALKQAADNYSA